MAGTLAAAGLATLLTGAAFGYVAQRVYSKPTPLDLRAANLALVVWWGGLGTYLALQGALSLLGASGTLTLGTYLASRVLAIPLLCGSVAGLLYHLVFLYTGSTTWSRIVAVPYAAVALFFLYVTFSTSQTLTIGDWLVEIDDSAPAYRVVYALVGVPVILACALYLSLLRRVEDPIQRRRVVLVAASIGAYVASGLVARLGDSNFLKFVTLVGFGLASAVLVLLAYKHHAPSPEAAP